MTAKQIFTKYKKHFIVGTILIAVVAILLGLGAAKRSKYVGVWKVRSDFGSAFGAEHFIYLYSSGKYERYADFWGDEYDEFEEDVSTTWLLVKI